MKTKFISLLALAITFTSVISCKGEKKNETEATAPEEVVAPAPVASSYTVDAGASLIDWIGKKPTENHTGTLKLSTGSIQTVDDKIQSGSFTIDMNSINVTDLEGDKKAGLEGHLKGEGEGKEDHFFNVAKFPTATFEMTGVSEKEGKTFIEGNLTLKGITKNISFPASITTSAEEVKLESEAFNIDRTQWGVNYKSKSVLENLGDKFILDDIELKISVVAKKA